MLRQILIVIPWLSLLWVGYTHVSEPLLRIFPSCSIFFHSLPTPLVASLTAPLLARISATCFTIYSDMIPFLSTMMSPVLLSALTIVNLVLFYEFLRTRPFAEQVQKGAMLLSLYGIILLWIYDPIVLGTVILCATIWGMIYPP